MLKIKHHNYNTWKMSGHKNYSRKSILSYMHLKVCSHLTYMIWLEVFSWCSEVSASCRTTFVLLPSSTTTLLSFSMCPVIISLWHSPSSVVDVGCSNGSSSCRGLWDVLSSLHRLKNVGTQTVMILRVTRFNSASKHVINMQITQLENYIKYSFELFTILPIHMENFCGR